MKSQRDVRNYGTYNSIVQRRSASLLSIFFGPTEKQGMEFCFGTEEAYYGRLHSTTMDHERFDGSSQMDHGNGQPEARVSIVNIGTLRVLVEIRTEIRLEQLGNKQQYRQSGYQRQQDCTVGERRGSDFQQGRRDHCRRRKVDTLLMFRRTAKHEAALASEPLSRMSTVGNPLILRNNI